MKSTLNFIFPGVHSMRFEESENAVIVCHCKAVNDRRIRDAVRSGAKSCGQVARACQAGGHCGGCHPGIREIIHSECNRDPLPAGIDEVAVAAS